MAILLKRPILIDAQIVITKMVSNVPSVKYPNLCDIEVEFRVCAISSEEVSQKAYFLAMVTDDAAAIYDPANYDMPVTQNVTLCVEATVNDSGNAAIAITEIRLFGSSYSINPQSRIT
ncbi:MAG: hypothetical protein ABIR91_02360 [Candidatus Saccharimonadales bacterium]